MSSVRFQSWLPILLSMLTRAVAADESVPEIFAPGVISGPAHDSAPAFTPDGNTVYFTRSNWAQSTIVVSQRRNGAWSTARIAPFSGTWNDMEATMSADGAQIVFVSNRPAPGAMKPLDGFFNNRTFPGHGGNLWSVRRDGSGWGEPKRLPDAVNASSSTFAPSLAADGSVYFMRPDDNSGKFRLFRAQFRDGDYQEGEPVSFSDGSSGDVDPAVAPDESFIVFSSGRIPNRGMDLFIAFRENGVWAAPIHLGETVNSTGSDAEARLSPDLRTLYFASDRTVPVTFPRDAAKAQADLDRLQAWDNGNYNIWRVSLAPWLDAHGVKRGR